MTLVSGDAIDRFVTALEKKKDAADRAALAVLKRCAGRRLGECPHAMRLFYGLLSSKPGQYEEEHYFLVATLFPTAPSAKNDESLKSDLGWSLRLLTRAEGVNADGVDRRVSVLLDADLEQLRFRLRQALQMLGSKGIPVNWRLLLYHLLHWGDTKPATGVPSGWV